MLKKVRETVAKHGLLCPGDHVLASVSGGADSMALLYSLHWLSAEYDLRLTIAHLDHGIRQDTALDLAVVKTAAEALGLPLMYEKRDVPTFAKQEKRNLEEAARIVRREFLERAAKEVGAKKIALGHTRTDLAETVLLHLLRGAGLRGLRGMLPMDPPYIRPLISCSREETRTFCQEEGIPFHDDPTNLDRRYLRNAIRLEVLPLLRRYNPRAEEALARAAELLAEADQALGWAADHVLSEVRDGETIDAKRLESLPKGVRALAVREAAARALGSSQGLTRKHIEEILDLFSHDEAGEIFLPGGHRARVEGGRLVFVREIIPLAPFTRELPLSGKAIFPDLGWRFSLFRIPRPPDLRPPRASVAYLDPRRIVPPLYIRSRRPGDRLRPLGMREEKKVHELMMEAKIPRSERDRWPLLCDQRGIIWVVGVRISDDHKVADDVVEVLRIDAERMR